MRQTMRWVALMGGAEWGAAGSRESTGHGRGSWDWGTYVHGEDMRVKFVR